MRKLVVYKKGISWGGGIALLLSAFGLIVGPSPLGVFSAPIIIPTFFVVRTLPGIAHLYEGGLFAVANPIAQPMGWIFILFATLFGAVFGIVIEMIAKGYKKKIKKQICN